MEQLKIGTLTLPHRAVFGPMAGFTDAPCRRLMAQHGAGFTVSEMVSGRALVYQDRKTAALLRAEPNDAPYGVQLFGDDPEIMGQAAALIEGVQFDFLDINMGCPAPKIVSAGAGSKLMLDPELCGRIVEQVAAHTTRPVTVKMRKGWDADHITAVECAKACAQAGASGRALVYQDRKTAALLRAEPNDAPYGVQLFGDDPEIMGQAAALIEGEQFDFLDINMGCPAPKIVSAGAGSKLMLDPELCGRIVEQVAAHTTRPVTVKMRKGWDADHITAVECAKACAQAGAAAIAVHARTRAEMYTPGIDLTPAPGPRCIPRASIFPLLRR